VETGQEDIALILDPIRVKMSSKGYESHAGSKYGMKPIAMEKTTHFTGESSGEKRQTGEADKGPQDVV